MPGGFLPPFLYYLFYLAHELKPQNIVRYIMVCKKEIQGNSLNSISHNNLRQWIETAMSDFQVQDRVTDHFKNKFCTYYLLV